MEVVVVVGKVLTLISNCYDNGSDAQYGCRWNVRENWRELNGSREVNRTCPRPDSCPMPRSPLPVLLFTVPRLACLPRIVVASAGAAASGPAGQSPGANKPAGHCSFGSRGLRKYLGAATAATATQFFIRRTPGLVTRAAALRVPSYPRLGSPSGVSEKRPWEA